MAFTQDYIALCYKYRSIYRGKSPKTGDWYGNMTTSQLKLMTAESKTDFNNPEWFYIPDLDDLFELLAHQIKACQGKEVPADLVELVFDPATNWSVRVKLTTGIIVNSLRGKSPHEVLFKAVFQMAHYVNNETDVTKELPNEKGKPGFFEELVNAIREVRRMRRGRVEDKNIIFTNQALEL